VKWRESSAAAPPLRTHACLSHCPHDEACAGNRGVSSCSALALVSAHRKCAVRRYAHVPAAGCCVSDLAQGVNFAARNCRCGACACVARHQEYFHLYAVRRVPLFFMGHAYKAS